MTFPTEIHDVAPPWRLLDGYHPLAGAYDEMVASAGVLRPHCEGFVLVPYWRTRKPARKWVLAALGLASWVAVVFDIVLHHEFTCMHCAERCLVKVNTNTPNSMARHDD